MPGAQHIFSCDNWILFFCQTQGNNRSSNLISNVLNVDVRGIYILDEGFCVVAQMTDCSCLIGCCRNCAAALIGLRSGQTLPRVSFKVSYKEFSSVSSSQVCWKAWKVSGLGRDSGRHNPPQLHLSSQSHSSHLPRGPQWEKKVGIKINQTSIHFPAI